MVPTEGRTRTRRGRPEGRQGGERVTPTCRESLPVGGPVLPATRDHFVWSVCSGALLYGSCPRTSHHASLGREGRRRGSPLRRKCQGEGGRRDEATGRSRMCGRWLEEWFK